MGIINPTNLLQFKKSDSSISEIKRILKSYDAAGMIDESDFHLTIKRVLDELGIGAKKECEIFLTIKNGRAQIPSNYDVFHAAYKVKPGRNTKIQSIPIEQIQPFIYYTDTEIYNEFNKKSSCCINCENKDKTKIIVRTFMNDTESVCEYEEPCLLSLDGNIRNNCDEDSPNIGCKSPFKINIENGYLLSNLEDDSIVYLQYFGIPLDENGMPMIPKESILQKAIEWEAVRDFFLVSFVNDNIPNLIQKLQVVGIEATKAMNKARYWIKLPSFQTMLNSARRQRTRNKFWYSPFDKTII